jgi:hypothetical protein
MWRYELYQVFRQVEAERERGKKATAKEGKKNLLTLPLRVCRKKMANSAIKTTPFASSFFNST